MNENMLRMMKERRLQKGLLKLFTFFHSSSSFFYSTLFFSSFIFWSINVSMHYLLKGIFNHDIKKIHDS